MYVGCLQTFCFNFFNYFHFFSLFSPILLSHCSLPFYFPLHPFSLPHSLSVSFCFRFDQSIQLITYFSILLTMSNPYFFSVDRSKWKRNKQLPIYTINCFMGLRRYWNYDAAVIHLCRFGHEIVDRIIVNSHYCLFKWLCTVLRIVWILRIPPSSHLKSIISDAKLKTSWNTSIKICFFFRYYLYVYVYRCNNEKSAAITCCLMRT